MKYRNLLSPIKIGGSIIKNRMTYPNASPHFLQGPETFPAEGYRAFNANLAKNGAAIICVAEWNDPTQHKGPADADFTHMQSFDTSDPSVQNYISQLCEEVHFFGSKIILHREIDYPEGYSLYGGDLRLPGPPKPLTEKLPKELISETIAKNVRNMKAYKNMGYDGISIRCDHLMKPGGCRDDEYDGGTIENRTRFLHEMFAAMKKELGSKFIIEGVLAWEQTNGYMGGDKMGSGYTKEDALEFLRLFEDVIDILEVREKDGCLSHPTGYNFTQGVHPAVDFCAEAKAQGIKILMKPVGGFQEPDEMDRLIAEGKCDLIGMARGFIADDKYGVKVYEGNDKDITPCIKCNKCHGVMLPEPAPWTSVCSVNPLVGLGHKLHRLVDDCAVPRKVAVIGGGPAGIRAALYASDRGHEVTLFEKTDKLGGQLFHSDYFSFKWPVKNYRDWLVEQLEKSNVQVKMNTCPTREEIESEDYYVVIAATGAVPAVPRIEGVRNADGSVKAQYKTCLDILGHEEVLGGDIVIIGGSEVGMETAMYLCGLGKNVTVLTRQSELGHNASHLHYVTMAFVMADENGLAKEAAAWEAYDNLTGITGAGNMKVESLDTGKERVYYQTKDGNEYYIEADNVIICGGMSAQTDEAMKYAGISDKYFAIGDCNGAGNLELCNRQAYAGAMNI